MLKNEKEGLIKINIQLPWEIDNDKDKKNKIDNKDFKDE